MRPKAVVRWTFAVLDHEGMGYVYGSYVTREKARRERARARKRLAVSEIKRVELRFPAKAGKRGAK